MTKPATVETKVLSVPIPMTDAEKIVKSEMFARSTRNVESIKLEAKKSAAKFKARVSEAEAEMGELRLCVETGNEMRDLECYPKSDFEHSQIDWYALSDDRHVQTEKMDRETVEQLRQQRLAFERREAAAAKGVEDNIAGLEAMAKAQGGQLVLDGTTAPGTACKGCGIVAGGENTHRPDCIIAHPELDVDSDEDVAFAAIGADLAPRDPDADDADDEGQDLTGIDLDAPPEPKGEQALVPVKPKRGKRGAPEGGATS